MLTPGRPAESMRRRWSPCRRWTGPAIDRPAERRGRLHPDRRARRVRGRRRRLRGRGRHELPDQAGRASRTQQADAAAAHIAHRLGAAIDAEPFRPVLRGKLLTGEESLHLRGRRRRRRRRGSGLPRLPVVAAAQDQRPLPGALALPRGCSRRAGAAGADPRRRGGAAEGVARAADGARSLPFRRDRLNPDELERTIAYWEAANLQLPAALAGVTVFSRRGLSPGC